MSSSAPPIRSTVAIVALANLAYFGVEFAVGLGAGSAALLADSADFLEDACVNLLVFWALAWSARRRRLAGRCMALLLLAPAAAFLVAMVRKISDGAVPSPEALGWTGAGAMAVNLSCALLLARHRHAGGSLARAAFLSARNDVAANLAILAAAAVTWRWPTLWPDLIVGAGIALLNLDAAREVWQAADGETDEPRP